VDPDKRLLIGETWLYKVSEDEIINGLPYDDILARDVYSFWEPLDKQFHEIIYKLLHHKRFDAVAPFWVTYYFAYLTYGDPELEGLGPIELLARAGQEAIPNIATGTLNGTGDTFQEIILRPPDADGDGTPDSADTGDSDGDFLADNVEFMCGAAAREVGMRPERTDGVFAGVSDDGDALVDEPLPSGLGAVDCDGDGYDGATEDNVFGAANRRDQDACGTNGWAADFSSGGVPDSTNRITITDLTSFLAPTRRIDTSPGDGGFDVRWDLVPGPGLFVEVVNINDVTSQIVLAPPMLGGVRAFDGPACPYGP
jgi:hypothetical protein